MRDDYDDDKDAEEEDDLGFGKVKKSAVLDVEEDEADVIHADDADFELSDNLSFEDEEAESGFVLYETRRRS